MEELKITPKELKMLINDSEMINQGFFGTVFTYKDRLIKLDRVLYSLIRGSHEHFADEIVEKHYRYGREGIADPKQIELLASKQKDITLTKLPEGIVRINGAVPGIILPYHKDHQDLSLLPKDDYIKLLKVLRKLVLSVKELADNEIAHHDLVHDNRWKTARGYNIMYKGDTPQIIDLDGELIACGDKFKDAKEMYHQLGDVILGYFKANDLETSLTKEDVEDDKAAKRLLDELEERLRK